MRNRLESMTWSRPDMMGRNRHESISVPEISSTLMEITTIYENVKKGRDNDIYRLSKYGVPPPPENTQSNADEEEAVPMVPSFPSNLSEAQAVRLVDFNKYTGLPIRKYLYYSAATNTIQSDTLEGLSANYKELLKTEFYWLNITDPNESDLAVLFNSFNVHDFTIADIRETNTEEKIEFYQHYTFMSVRLLREMKIRHEPSSVSDSAESFGDHHLIDGKSSPTLHSRSDKKQQTVDMDFNILLFKNFVITMHDKRWSSINDILGFLNLVCTETVLTPDWVLYSIFIELAQDAQYLLAGIEPKLNELRVGTTSNIKEMSRVLRENYEMEFQLYAIQRFIKPKINILRTLKMKCGKRFGKTLLKLLTDTRDDFLEMNNDLRNLNHILERSQDTFLALVSVEKSREANEMSMVMKRISQIALIFLPIQAVSGFFGMNVFVPFQNYTETQLPFWLIVLFSFTISVIMYCSRSFFIKKLNCVDASEQSRKRGWWHCFRRRGGGSGAADDQRSFVDSERGGVSLSPTPMPSFCSDNDNNVKRQGITKWLPPFSPEDNFPIWANGFLLIGTNLELADKIFV